MSAPGELRRKAVRLEWLTVAYLAAAVALLSVSRGASQAVNAAWLECLASLAAPVAFLAASRLRRHPPSRRFPHGYQRVEPLACLGAALPPALVGLFVLYGSVSRLLEPAHPSVGLVEPFGVGPVWLGWLMLAALACGILPATFLGRAKLPLARGLHDPLLSADAEMSRAAWLTAGAAMLGVAGMGFGLWWADAVAASVVALRVAGHGWKRLRAAVEDLMDAAPAEADRAAVEPRPGLET